MGPGKKARALQEAWKAVLRVQEDMRVFNKMAVSEKRSLGLGNKGPEGVPGRVGGWGELRARACPLGQSCVQCGVAARCRKGHLLAA